MTTHSFARRLLGAAGLFSGVLTATSALGQDLTLRATPQEMPIALVHATVHTVSGADIVDGYVVFDKGVITDVGSMAGGRVFAATFQQVDVTGKHVYPGLIGAVTQMGLTEFGAVRPTLDIREVGDVTPEVFAAVAVNADSTLIPVTRENGVLACGVFPTGGVVPGRASVIRMEGWTWEEMTVSRDAGLVVNWPLMRTVTARWMDKNEEDQRKDIRKNLERLEDVFRAAGSYARAKAAGDTALPTDIRWEAMRGVFADAGNKSPQKPVFIEASDYDQITAALDFAGRQNLKVVIVGGRDAPLCAALMKERHASVIVPGTHQMPKRDDSAYDEPYSLPARLEAAGITWCMASGEETAHERNLPYNAGRAVAYGLSKAAALRSITLSAAECLGVDSVLGSLDKGKEATLLVTSGDPMEMSTVIHAAYIQGKTIELTSKQDKLAEKYRKKYAKPSQSATGPAREAERRTK